MEHPKLFTADDPVVARIRELCADYPESAEVLAWGRPTFRAGKKIFVVAGATMDHPHTVVFKPDPEEHPALLELPEIFVPPYFGPSGWLAIEVGDRTDWQFVAELIETSFRQVALKRQLAALDSRPAPDAPAPEAPDPEAPDAPAPDAPAPAPTSGTAGTNT
ncbi:MmcQ/YjbR family DNA-binding protein [Herbiconiux daphne]|uniref:MmcQ/YjbR family DNA-binding protein n=1 Tax=Herbiconiux daphne TaxID=2970914 RepID=A0ABT2GX59_9MICO|nr:MmcQ/YjbR family DNA-binding protein [Herbiconiux daphne]MCS5732540.1 MmcQ/YjbR family DNA-binding protein [Herbiconiux daphne]